MRGGGGGGEAAPEPRLPRDLPGQKHSSYKMPFLLTLAALAAIIASTMIVFDRSIEQYLSGNDGNDGNDLYLGIYPPGSIKYAFLDQSWYNNTDIYAKSYERHVETYDDFRIWREGTINQKYNAAAHTPSNISILSTTQHDGYTLDHMRIDGIDTYRATPEQPNGKGVMIVPGAGNGGIRDIMGVPSEDSPQYYHDNVGIELVTAGYTVYAPELLGWGIRQVDVGYECVGNEHYACAYVPLKWALSSYGIDIREVHANETAVVVSYAASKHGRLGVATISYGCGPALDVALASPRHVDALIMASCWIGPRVVPFNTNIDVVHGMNKHYGGIDPLRALAPLPLYVSYGAEEAPFILYIIEQDGVRSMVQSAYNMTGEPDNFTYIVHGAGHKYDAESVIEFLESNL